MRPLRPLTATLGVMNNRMRESMLWLFYEPRHAWICVGVIVVGVFLPSRFGFSEAAIRLAGLALQLAGIFTVVWGIVETRGVFGLQPVQAKLRSWWFRAPFRRRHSVFATSSGSFSVAGSLASAYVSVAIDPTNSIATQLAAVARNLDLIQERITGVQAEAVRNHGELKTQLFEQTSRIEDVRISLSDRLRTFGTSGLHISAIGAAWLFVGAVMGSASQELASLLK